MEFDRMAFFLLLDYELKRIAHMLNTAGFFNMYALTYIF